MKMSDKKVLAITKAIANAFSLSSIIFVLIFAVWYLATKPYSKTQKEMTYCQEQE